MAMRSIVKRIESEKVLVSDGAWGTFLQRHGLKAGECPELLCVERPDAVRHVAATYVAAGADLVKTNSFGANRFKLEHYGLARRTAELNERAAALSRQAAGDAHGVLASMGPTGKLLLMGDVTDEELYEAFKEQAQALERGGADACLIETFAAIDEAVLAVRAARENTKLEVFCTFTFERTLQGEYRSMMGVSPTDAAPALLEAGAHVIGSNCGNGMAAMVDIVREFRRVAPTAPLAIHANAGIPKRVAGQSVYPESPEEMAANALQVREAGANVIGGCCGSGPDHIRAMVAALKGGRA
jgi:5-methyltetrahydrofolate--homocysteine methyltransferase